MNRLTMQIFVDYNVFLGSEKYAIHVNINKSIKKRLFNHFYNHSQNLTLTIVPYELSIKWYRLLVNSLSKRIKIGIINIL